jgi:hypothetical protein
VRPPEAFAANVLPIVRQIQAAGVSGLQNIADGERDADTKANTGGKPGKIPVKISA